MSMRIRSIIVVAYFGSVLLEYALGGLDKDEYVVIVDNSSDSKVESVALRAGARYLDAKGNRGFAAGVNLGLAHLSDAGRNGDVLLLNPDARLGSADIDALQDVFDRGGNDRIAAVSPRLRSPDGTMQRVAWPFPAPGAMWREALRLRDHRPQNAYVVGAVLLLRREALADVGRFDERYFLYAEETDWQRRAMLRGWRSAVVEVFAEHVGAGTSSDSRRRAALFHAGHEIYIRRWFGSAGWLSYRAAAMVGAAVRSVAGKSSIRADARTRFVLYLRGPRKLAQLAPRSEQLRVTHLVVTGNQAGTERYVAMVAAKQSLSGLDVTVIGGNPTFVRTTLPSTVRWLPGASIATASASILKIGRQDIVHTHLTAADLLAVLTRPAHRGRVISTRHIAKPRGANRINRALAHLLERFISKEIAVSSYLASVIGRESIVLHTGVATSDFPHQAGDGRTVLVVQRLDPEKRTWDAVEAWRLSGLGERGWRLLVCGEGSQLGELQRYALQMSIKGIEWLGWVDAPRQLMQSAVALIATTPSESLGLTVLEAMSEGLPVIAVNAGGYRETVGGCPGALMYEPGDVAACASLLKDLSEKDDQARARYGAALRERQRSEFDVDGHVAQVAGLYRRVSCGA